MLKNSITSYKCTYYVHTCRKKHTIFSYCMYEYLYLVHTHTQTIRVLKENLILLIENSLKNKEIYIVEAGILYIYNSISERFQ